MIIRFYTVRKVSEARISAGWALLFIAILYTTAPAVAVFARTNLLQTVRFEQDGELTDVRYEDVPDWFKNWEATGLIEFNDANNDGRIQYRGEKSDVENELTIDPDIMVLANPEIAKLPNWVVGLVAAGGLAAALSTAAGLLLVISTAVAHDLIKGTIVRHLSEKHELMAACIAAGVAVCIAGYFGINPPGFVGQVVAFAFGLAASSFFPAIVMGIFSKRMNKAGAVSGMIVGITFTAAYIIFFKFINPAMNTPEYWWWGISPEGIGTLGMVLNFIVSISVAAFTPPPPDEVQALVEDIRLP